MPTSVGGYFLQISSVVLQPNGDPLVRYVAIRNSGEGDISIAGWVIADRVPPIDHLVLPEATLLHPGDVLSVVYEGMLGAPCPESSRLVVFWCQGTTIERLAPWNEDGDVVVLSTPAGVVVAEWDYTSAVGTQPAPDSLPMPAAIAHVSYAPQEFPFVLWVTVQNTSGQTLDLSGWEITDVGVRTHRLQIPHGTVLAAGERFTAYYTLRVNQECPEPGRTFVYWCSADPQSSRADGAVHWDAAGDVVRLLDPQGHEVDRWTYTMPAG